MKIFIDDSGGFGWSPPGISLFCALTVSDSSIDELSRAFDRRRVRQPGFTVENELKGKHLSPTQQASFASSTLLANAGVMLTLAGTDTRSFNRPTADEYVQNSADVLRAAAKRAARLEKSAVADFYNRMGGWVSRRSPENALWLLTLVKTIHLSIQHSIVLFADEPDEHEFEDIEILIDRSFIKKERHIEFWSEWLRAFLFRGSWMTPKEWSEAHPFNRKYRGRPGLLDMGDLFRNHMRFVESKETQGIQIADICANICYRRYSGKPKYQPYRLLRPRIRGRQGSEMHMGVLNESSLLKDAPENHVRFFSEHDVARWAEEARRRVLP